VKQEESHVKSARKLEVPGVSLWCSTLSW